MEFHLRWGATASFGGVECYIRGNALVSVYLFD